MSADPQAMLVDTTRAISSTSSPALVMPAKSDPSLLAPGGKWYMVYVPPGGTLPIAPLLSSVTLRPRTSAPVVSVAEATSSLSEPQSSNNNSTSSTSYASDIGNNPPRRQRGKACGKSRRAWRERMAASRQSQMMPRPNPNFYQPNFEPQSKCVCGFANVNGCQTRPLCTSEFH